MTHRQLSDFWIASCKDDGGAHLLRLYDDGSVEELKKIDMPRPMYLIERTEGLYTVLRTPYPDSNVSAAALYSYGGRQLIFDSTRGEAGCHLAVLDGTIYSANYLSGSLYSTKGNHVIHSGSSVNLERQESAHIHSTFPSPDGRFILSCDLGLDKVFVYNKDLTLHSSVDTPKGAGPRHLCFSKDGSFVYVVNEMGGSISAFSYSDGILEYLNTLPLLPDGFSEDGAGSAIKLSLDGKRLYVSERAQNKIFTVSVSGKDMKVLSSIDCGGDHPRDIELLANDGYLVSTNQFSDNLTFFKLDPNGIPSYLSSYSIPAPLCAVESKLF